MPSEAPGPESRGFIRVGSLEPALWMRCESCGRADDFWLDTAAHCGCGAHYAFALKPDGTKAPLSELRFVPFAQGPVQLASMEWDWTVLALVSVAVVGTISILTIGWLR